jgi:L-amino acid N-acyltransferase YncA
MIRASTPLDIPAVTRIYAEAVLNGTATFELVPPDEEEMSRRRTSLVDGGFPYLVADLSGEVAGYAYAAPFRTRPAYAFTVEDSIYVAPAWQGKGIGRALLNALVAECETRGFRQMIAVIGDSANEGSVALHLGAGFEAVGTIRDVGRKHGRWLDTPILQKSLGTGAHQPPEDEPTG